MEAIVKPVLPESASSSSVRRQTLRIRYSTTGSKTETGRYCGREGVDWWEGGASHQ